MVGDTRGTRRVDLKEAAVELGITSEAVRRRAKRGSLPSETGDDGRLYVWLPDVSDAGPHGVSDSGSHDGPHDGPHGVSDNGSHGGGDQDDHRHLHGALLERFEDENEFLRRELERLHRELERKDAILLTMAQRIPELEAPQEASETPPRRSEAKEGEERVQDDGEHLSWWRRLFG